MKKTNETLSTLVANRLAIRMIMGGGGNSYKSPTQVKSNNSRFYFFKGKIPYFLIFIFFVLFLSKSFANNSNYDEIIGRVSENKTKNSIIKEKSIDEYINSEPDVSAYMGGTTMTITVASSSICSGQSTTVTYSWSWTLGSGEANGTAQYSTNGTDWINLDTISGSHQLTVSPTTTTTYYGRVMGNNGVLQHTATARTITVHSKPPPPIVQGAGTFCNSTTLEAMPSYSLHNICEGQYECPPGVSSGAFDVYPVYGYYNYSRSSDLVLRSEIPSCEPLITHLAVYVAETGSHNFTGIEIRLKKTTATTVSTTWDGSGSLVWSGSRTFNSVGWHLFELNTPFFWDSDNLLISWQHGYSARSNNSPTFFQSEHSSNLSSYGGNDSNFPTTLTISTRRPQYLFISASPQDNIYWQGTTSNGTSTSSPSTSQVVTESGTYYFRTQTPSTGCWSDAASATVTINKTNAGTISASQEICEGGTPDNLIGTNSSGHSYSWEVQEDCSGEWTAISGANAANYQPTSMNESACFRRKVEAECGTEYSASSSVSSNLKLHYTFNENIEPTYNFAVGEPAPTTSPTGYCSASSNTVEAISYVQFNGIGQASSNTSSSAYIDYTSVSTEVERGQTYATRLMGNTAGNYACGFTVWIDWNRDGVFDSNEMYQCGAISNSTGLDGKVATSSITVPTDAAYGPTRMRVRKNYNAYLDDPCVENSYGQTQDFTVIVKKPMFDPTFESYANGTNPGFTNQLASGSSIVEVSSTRAYQGSKSLRLNRLDGGGNGRVYLTRPINQGDVISYSVYCYSTVAGPRLRIEYNGGNYSWNSVQSSTHTGSGWERLTVTYPAATSATTGYFFMYSPNNNSDTYWDNMQIEKKTHATAFVNGSRNPGYVIDHSGNGNHGTIQAATSPEWTPNGYEAGAYKFDGVATKFIRGNVSFPAQNWTISTWVKKDAHTVQSYPIFVSFSLPYIACDGASSPFRLSYTGSGQTSISGTTVPVLGKWYHVVATSDATGTKLYVNGNLEASSSTVCTNTGGNFDIGRHLNSDTYRINGSVDELRVYDKALNVTEVKQLYEGGKIRIDVRPKPDMPTATKSPNVETVCVGQTLTLTGVNGGSGGVGTCNVQYRYSTNGGSSYTAWSTSLPSFAATGTNNRIQIRRNCTGNGCESEINTYVWTVVPDPILSAPTNVSICYGGNATFTSNLSNGTGVQNPVWQYSANGTSGWTNVVAGTPSNSTYSGQATATLAVSGNIPAGTYYYRRHLPATGVGCDATSSVAKLTVTAPPNAGTLSGNQNICEGQTTAFTISGNSATGVWSSSNTSIATVNSSGVITGVSSGTATITYTVTGTGGCADDETTRTVTVTAPPIAGTISGNQNICEGQTTTFTSNGDAGGVWSSSAETIATVNSSGVVTGVSAGTATITYTVVGAGGCADATATRTVTVTAPPNAGVLSGNQDICEGQTTTFTSNGDAGGVWSSSAETIATVNSSGVVTGVSAGTATITYFVAGTGGCADDKTTRTVTVTAPPTAPTLITGTTTICAGGSTTLTATGGSEGSGCTYQWYAGGCGSGTVLETTSSLSVSPSTTTTYYVRRVGTSPCNNTITSCASVTVTVTPNANAGIVSAGTTPQCIGQSTTYSVSGVNLGGNGTGSWSSSNTSVATVNASGLVSAVGAGTCNIIYTISGGCGSPVSSQASYTVSPNMTATSPSPESVCINTALSPITISTTNATGIGTPTGLPASVTASWTSNKITISGTPTVSGVYNYTIPLTGGCGTVSASGTITVNAPPTDITISNGGYLWYGQTSTDWETASNWLVNSGTQYQIASSAPSSSVNAFVTNVSGTCAPPNQPTVTSVNGICNNLTVSLTGNLSLAANQKLTIKGALNNAGTITSNSGNIDIAGNWTNTGTFNSGTGTVKFNGTSTQVIKAGSSAFNNVVFNNTASDIYDINITQPCTINGACTFTNGVVYYTGSGSLSFGNSATSNIGNANSYVNGSITKIGTSPFNFAVGEGEYWGPCAIAAPVENSTITAQYLHTAGPLNWTAAYMCETSGLHHTSGVEHWLLTSNASTPNVTLYWNANSGVSDINSLVVAHYNEALSCWENKGASNVSGSVSSGNITNSIAFTSYSPITFGTLSSANPLPVELISFSAECNDNNEVLLSWSTASEINNDYFEIQRSTQGIAWEVIATVQGAGFSNIILDYDYLDKEKPNTTTYYRLRQIDYDGSSKLSDIIQIRCENNMEKPVISVYPNPFTSSFNIEFENWDLNFAEIELLDITSRTIKKWNLENTLPNFIYEVNLSNLNPAMYMLKIKTSSGVIMRKIEKQ